MVQQSIRKPCAWQNIRILNGANAARPIGHSHQSIKQLFIKVAPSRWLSEISDVFAIGVMAFIGIQVPGNAQLLSVR